MKKKLLSLSLVVALAATAVLGTTLAYFTDEDSAKNVMTTRKVSIIQNEQERIADNGELQEFTDDKPLYPATGDANKDGKIDSYGEDIAGKTFVDADGKTQTIVVGKDAAGGTTNMMALANNAVDKIVTVTNNGTTDAYVRTLFAFEVPKAAVEGEGNLDKAGKYIDVVNVAPYLYTVMHEGATAGKGFTLPMENDDYIVVELEGTAYLICDYYYKNGSKLAPEETSHPSLKQVYLNSKATNEDAALVVGADGKYNILVLSQGAQTAGFTSAQEALDTAFGVVNAENCAKWFADIAK